MENKEKDFMISNFINTLIQDEWQAIESYNSAIATLSDHPEFDNVIEILKDIRDEEYIHVGQLESCLSILSDDPTENIEDGSEEGFEQLELPEDDEETELTIEEDFEPQEVDEETWDKLWEAEFGNDDSEVVSPEEFDDEWRRIEQFGKKYRCSTYDTEESR